MEDALIMRLEHSMSDEQGSGPIRRDRRGLFEQGVSANPAGRPRGIMNEAARIAAMLLTERAPDVVTTAIDMAVVGKDVPLKLCLDKIIASQKDQPVAFAMPPLSDAAGLAGAVAALWNAVAEGLVTPSQAASLSQALEAQTRAIEAQAAAREAAGEADPIYRSWVFRPAEGLFNSNAKST